MRSTTLRAALAAFLGLAVLLATLVAGLSVAVAGTKTTVRKPAATTSTTTIKPSATTSTTSATGTTSTTGTTGSTGSTSTGTAPTASTTTVATVTTTNTGLTSPSINSTPTLTVATTTAAAPTTATTTAAAPTTATTTAAAPTTATTTADAPTTAAAPAPSAPRFGMSYGERLTWMNQATLDATLDDAKALGLDWIRADLSWRTVQAGGATSWDWFGFDQLVRAANARGLKVLPILAWTPDWARDAGCTRFSCPPRDPAQFAAFAKAAVARYSPYGVTTWEVWNEPNLAQFWPVPDPVRYGTLLSTTSAAIKSVDPKATVLLGGLAALENTSIAIGPREYLNAVCLTGACSTVDAISYHPYTYPYPASYYATFSAWSKMALTPTSLRGVLGTFGLGSMPIWATEYGAPTDGDGMAGDGTWATTTVTTDHVTEAWQASIAKDAVQTADKDPNLKAFFWYTNQDLTNTTRKEASFGLRRLDGTAKPAWQAFKDAVAAAKAN